MAPKDLDKLIEKYLEGKCTERELKLIDSWYKSLGTDFQQIDGEILEEQTDFAENNVLRNIQSHAAPVLGEVPAEVEHSYFWRYTGIAAALLVCLLAIYYVFPPRSAATLSIVETSNESSTVFENFSDSSKRVILPDGSIVEMSPESSIRFSDDADDLARELHLEGEAYFDVAHNSDKPFYVYAGNMVTRVLGTTFIVRARGKDKKVTVSVKTGKVTVYSKNSEHKKTVLVPNQEAVYDRTTDVVATRSPLAPVVSNVVEKSAEMHFEETPVSEVLRILTKTYDIQIVFAEDALSGCVLTSSFFDEGLYDRIDVICTAIGATYKIVDSQIVIESQGCNLKPNKT